MIQQIEFTLKAKSRGLHLVTNEIKNHLPCPLPEQGILNLFVKHTSCALTINENADPDVRSDLEKIMNHIVREGEPYYEHTLEGLDDMPSHGKSSLFGVSINIPISHSRLNLGTWQGIYLCEFCNHGGPRSIVATIYC
jgi:secondary thiamine-phosphate synthase enzyme